GPPGTGRPTRRRENGVWRGRGAAWRDSHGAERFGAAALTLHYTRARFHRPPANRHQKNPPRTYRSAPIARHPPYSPRSAHVLVSPYASGMRTARNPTQVNSTGTRVSPAPRSDDVKIIVLASAGMAKAINRTTGTPSWITSGSWQNTQNISGAAVKN